MAEPDRDQPAQKDAAQNDTDQNDADPAEPSTKDAIRASLHDAVRNSGLGQVSPGEVPRASSLLRAIGGIRGLTESLLPGLGFLLVYTFTKDVAMSVLAPVVVALVFVLIRLVSKSSATLAFAGLFGVGVSASLALMTGRAEDSFVPGLIINVVSVVVLVTSILFRWPFIGIIVGLLANEGASWRMERAKRFVLTLATWLWVGLFALRLIVQAPLYFTDQTELLATTKLLMGVPFYAAMVWVTWLLVRSVYPRPTTVGPRDETD